MQKSRNSKKIIKGEQKNGLKKQRKVFCCRALIFPSPEPAVVYKLKLAEDPKCCGPGLAGSGEGRINKKGILSLFFR